MNDTSHDIRILNGLTATTIDSIDGYEESAKAVESGRFAEMFRARADERRQVVTQLRSEVARLGGNPEEDGTILAATHRTFLDLKAAVTTRDDKAIIDEVERGEDHIKAKFENALKDERVSPEARSVIESAFQPVKAGHDQMSALKHSMTA